MKKLHLTEVQMYDIKNQYVCYVIIILKKVVVSTWSRFSLCGIEILFLECNILDLYLKHCKSYAMNYTRNEQTLVFTLLPVACVEPLSILIRSRMFNASIICNDTTSLKIIILGNNLLPEFVEYPLCAIIILKP